MKRLAINIRQSLNAKSLQDNRKTWSLGALAAMSKNPTAAETLLREVNQRLALQHGKCLDMINILSTPSPAAAAPSAPSQSSSPKKVIRAVNVTVDQHSSTTNTITTSSIHRKKEDILKKLQLLETLHADTFAITEHLLTTTAAVTPCATNKSNQETNKHPIVFSRFSKADQHLLAATFEQIRSRHASTVENLADIITEWRQHHQQQQHHNSDLHNLHNPLNIDMFMEQFLKDRLGIQLLCDHYVGLSKDRPGGGISVHVDFHQVLLEAMTESKHVCDANYGIVPHVHFISNHDQDNNAATTTTKVTVVRPWVHHALVELFKNGMASSVQKMTMTMTTDNHLHNPPDLLVRMRYHPEKQTMLVCEIIDQGVGFKDEEEIQRAFQFATSSTGQRWDRLKEQQSYGMVRSPISSLGVGLPLSRMMMQRFGGDVILKRRSEPIQIDSFTVDTGCTAYLYVPLRDDIEEVL